MILDISKYPNAFDEPDLLRWNLTNEKIVQMVCNYPIELIYKTDPLLSDGTILNKDNNSFEKNRNIPPYYIPLWDNLRKTGRIESQNRSWEMYYEYDGYFLYTDESKNIINEIRSYQDFFKIRKHQDRIKKMKAKYQLAYPSLVRDINCYLLISENIKEFKVIYNNDLDHKEGIDILLINKIGKRIGLKLFADTERSNGYSSKKDNRHGIFDDVDIFKIPFQIDFNNEDLQLYGEKDLDKLRNILKDYL